MNKKIIFVIGFILTSTVNTVTAQEKLELQLVDSYSKTGIPYAYIKVLDRNILEVSNIDGFFSIPDLKEDSIQISHVAYKTIRTSIEKIKEIKKIEMTELAIETNPIIISAKSAKSLVEKAIDSTYKALYEPMFLTCFRRDQVFYRDTLVAEATAEIVYIFKKFTTASFGGIYKGYLKNIKVFRSPSYDIIKIPSYSVPALYAPLNRFISGTSIGTEKHLYYSNQDANDSIIIIAMNPKRDFVPKNYMLKYGRFIINKSNWRLIRIDTHLSSEMMELGRNRKLQSNIKGKFPHFYSTSHFFNDEGILSGVEFKYHFSYNEDNNDNLWENHSSVVFITEKTKPEFDESTILKTDTLLIQMNSKYSPEFEKRFIKYVH